MAVFSFVGSGYKATVLDVARKFMNDSMIAAWMNTPNDDLNGQRPSSLVDDRLGAQMVLALLQRKPS